MGKFDKISIEGDNLDDKINLKSTDAEERLGFHARYRLRLLATLGCAQIYPEKVEVLEKIEAINESANNFHIYDTDRFSSIHPESALTFHPSPESFELPKDIKSQLEVYGIAIRDYYWACKKLMGELPSDHPWLRYLGHSKPEWMLDIENKEERAHAFLRPDLILTDSDPIVTEIESSPFGLALSHFLAKAYRKEGESVLGSEDEVIEILRKELVSENDDSEGVYALMYTDYTSRYKGQLEYLAQQLSVTGIDVAVIKPGSTQKNDDGMLTYNGRRLNGIYRCFYLHESVGDPNLRDVLESQSCTISPPVLPQLEEKALIGMLLDPEFEEYFQGELGPENFDILKTIFPKTWIIDREFKPNDFPFSIKEWEDLAGLSRRQRQFVLKTSGFSNESSWAKGVIFMSRLSREKCEVAIKKALDSDGTYVLQEFRKGVKFKHPYFDFHAEMMKTMHGRVRLTPYFSVQDGKLLTAKATMCENTDYVHAMVDSINVPVK